MLEEEILDIYKASKCRYGAPKIYEKLKSKNIFISLKRIQKLMNKLGIKSVVCKKFRPFSSKNKVENRENIINRDFSITGINQKWVTDITYIHTIKDGWCYLAPVMDLNSRKIVGYFMSKNIDTTLLKKEEVNLVKYFDFDAVRLAIFEYIESWYNRERIHSSLGYISPQEWEDKSKRVS